MGRAVEISYGNISNIIKYSKSLLKIQIAEKIIISRKKKDIYIYIKVWTTFEREKTKNNQIKSFCSICSFGKC